MKKKKKLLTKEEEIYDRLRQKFEPDVGIPIPLTPVLSKLQKFFCPTAEHAELCLLMNITTVADRSGGKTAAELAAESGKDIKKVEVMLEELGDRGTIYRAERQGEPGILEFSLEVFWSIAETLSLVNQHGPIGIAHHELVTAFYDSGARQEWGRSEYPMWRTLTVNEVIDSASKVLWWETAQEIIKKHDKIAIAYCGCRVRERKCNHRIDTCFVMGPFADAAVHHSKDIPGSRLIHYITQEKALKRLEECIKEGLVPLTFNSKDLGKDHLMPFICMCCSCCCHILATYHRGNTGWGDPYALQKSNLRPEWDRQKCILCNKCVDMCPVNALWHHYPHKADLSDDYIFYEKDRCIGCGICAFNCPSKAIIMKKVSDFEPESTLMETIMKHTEKAVH